MATLEMWTKHLVLLVTNAEERTIGFHLFLQTVLNSLKIRVSVTECIAVNNLLQRASSRCCPALYLCRCHARTAVQQCLYYHSI